jgi:hypothetical protein
MDSIKNELIVYKQKLKFADEVWENKGLIPPDKIVSATLQSKFDQIIDNIIELKNEASTNKQLSDVIKNGFKLFKKSDYDTEERELIGDTFMELAGIINVNIAPLINKWLYGSIVSNLMKLLEANSKAIFEILKEPCSGCGIELESFVTERRNDIPDSFWNIAKCNSCGTLSILSHGPGIAGLKFGNYQWLGTLGKDEYNYEQALEKAKHTNFKKHMFHY